MKHALKILALLNCNFVVKIFYNKNPNGGVDEPGE